MQRLKNSKRHFEALPPVLHFLFVRFSNKYFSGHENSHEPSKVELQSQAFIGLVKMIHKFYIFTLLQLNVVRQAVLKFNFVQSNFLISMHRFLSSMVFQTEST